ncbi:MAG: flagellar protein FliS, partial [Sphingomonadaceae bacterium]
MSGARSYPQVRQTPAFRYQNIELASRIESATPHGLVALLYSERQLSLAVLARAVDVGDHARRAEQHLRAASIIHALDA